MPVLRFALILLACSSVASADEPYPSTYRPGASNALLFRNATLLIGNGQRLDAGDVLVKDGRIAAVGTDLPKTEGVIEIDAHDRTLTPGIIDIHSHLGVYPSPGLKGHQDGNEMSDPVTAGVWAEHSVRPEDPGFDAARAAGVTSLLVLPGSANLIGGRGVVLRNVPSVTYQGMKFPGAPQALKMACGENPKRVYGQQKGRAPTTRMGNVAGYRQAFADAQQYLDEWQRYDTERADYDKKKDRDKAREEPVGPLALAHSPELT